MTDKKPVLSNLNIINVSKNIKNASVNAGKSIYSSVRNATAKDVANFTAKAGTNMAAGVLTKAFVGAALAGSAPAVVTVGATAIAVGAVSTKITHWRDCKKAIANNEEPPIFNWKNYGLKGMFNTAMVGLGAFFSDSILGLFDSEAPVEPSTDGVVVSENIAEPEAIQPIEKHEVEIVALTDAPEMPAVVDIQEEVLTPEISNIDIAPVTLPNVSIEPPVINTPPSLDTVADLHVSAESLAPVEAVNYIPPVMEAPTLEAADIPSDIGFVASEFSVTENVQVMQPVELIQPVQEVQPLTIELETPQIEEPVIVAETIAPAIALPVEEAISVEPIAVPSIESEPIIANDVVSPTELVTPELQETLPSVELQAETVLQPNVISEDVVSDVAETLDEAEVVVAETITPTEMSVVEELQVFDLGPRAEAALEAHINGNAQGTADLGYFYFHGEQGIPQDYERAVELYREAAAAGNRFALRDLAFIENQAEKALGYAVPETPEAIDIAEVEIEAAVDQSNADVVTIEELIALSIEDLQELDLGPRAEAALEAHLNGNAQGTADLGYFYFHGEQGIPQDYEKAVQFYREAAAEGNRFAMRDLAFIESQAEKALGYAVPETPSAMEAEVTLANDNNVVELQTLDLGSRAETALEAHINGNAQGTADLGYFYFHGEQNLPQDLEKAVEFYREAALDGNSYAIRDLAFIESEAVKSGITLTEFELPAHLYSQAAPTVDHNVSSGSGQGVRSGMRANCVGNLQGMNGSNPQLQFDCNVRGNHGYIYPGEHVKVSLPNGVSQTFNLDANTARQPVNAFLQNSVLPEAAGSFGLN